ncbi:hypothetical protein AcW1_006757 [Taiwanofungus camphoratus]|nr:hypothetical protein AcV5_009347 [Antrodia cinnamomea]KAI0924725.1 hypothetical protein AcW2_005521 [Antrodia cinnamomea]KAI0953915.1 hypothetical protein AcV7_007310 [Antrodia cinnamomea]KAI0955063.1 hypothetical protein AcW1_006757 [Antrodia cinnamomea]
MSAYPEYNKAPNVEVLGQGDAEILERGPKCESGSLDAALASASRRTLRYEHQMKDLEAKLAVDLSNSRAINNLLQEVLSGLHQNQRRADAALTSTVPHISQSLDEDLAILYELEEHLPQVGRQIRDIRQVYDHGRDKARDLISALEWMNTPVSLRLRTIIFTPNAPVSARWKALVRTLFALVFLVGVWIAWITLRGAIRAHRQRLVWGERLMS